MSNYPKIKAKNKKQYLVKIPPSTIAVGIFLAIPDFLNKSRFQKESSRAEKANQLAPN